MALRELKTPIRRLAVQVNDEEKDFVRGLNPTDVIELYIAHSGEASALFERLVAQWRGNGNTVDVADVLAIALEVAQYAPNIMAELLAIAFGGDTSERDLFAEDVEIARRLPFPVQADAFNKIASLTFTSDMPPGKFVALIIDALSKVTGAMGAVFQKLSPPGSGSLE